VSDAERKAMLAAELEAIATDMKEEAESTGDKDYQATLQHAFSAIDQAIQSLNEED
jgi:hypothetical protein